MQPSVRSFEVHTYCYGYQLTRRVKAQGLLEEIRRQSSVSVLSGPAIVITSVATASVFLAKGRSTESVSRVVRTARTAREIHEKERVEHAELQGQHEKYMKRNAPTEHQKPDGEGQMDVDLESRRRMRGKNRLTSLEQPSAPTANTSPDTSQQQTQEYHENKRRRIDEFESTVPTAAQDEVLVPCPETFDSVRCRCSIA